MGRRPNALIIQYFERGAKLPDSSNRYQHTCKACGEKFPKGRIDTLTAHLVKKCPALSIQDRQNALLQLNDLPNIDRTEVRRGETSSVGQAVELPIVNSNWTALETLAEVSRQFDLNEKHDDRSHTKKGFAGHGIIAEPSCPDLLKLHEQYTLENPPMSYEQRPHRERKTQNQKTTRQKKMVSSYSSPGLIGNASTESSNLTTVTTTRMTAAAAAKFMPSMVDPQLLGDDMNVHPSTSSNSQQTYSPPKTLEQALSEAGAAFTDEMFHHCPSEQQFTWSIVDSSGTDPCLNIKSFENTSENTETSKNVSFSRIEINPSLMTTEFSAEYGTGQKFNRPKVRGRFSATRRKEVQEVRKRGACIRCRMLKKPCSEGTPCNTCKSVESARLWKTPCIRTRVADELEMYSAGLHTVLAYRELNNVKNHSSFRPSMQQVDASHYPETGVFATFNSLEGYHVSTEGNIDPNLGSNSNNSTLRILDNENDDLASKLESYSRRMSSFFYEREPSKFMHTTLSFAHELATSKQDILLKRALELWSIVHILVDHEMSWKLSERNNTHSQNGQGPSIYQSSPCGTHNLICSQLNALAEKKASSLCKSILNELERRLLQRTASDSFETFLVVLITLNCIEKSTWLFKSWEQESFKYRWPLDKTPVSISSQGERLADLLQMLLRMRNVPPKTYTRPEDGILATDATPLAQEYYEKLKFSYVHVLSKQANHIFDSGDSRCFELHFCSRLLLPVS
ncbi:hypothetical protein K3495_g12051 [Podosphaera aphanis]|nr:hypothetical protein K3495_g12051 [Podosphaera aphanis]